MDFKYIYIQMIKLIKDFYLRYNLFEENYEFFYLRKTLNIFYKYLLN